MDCPATFICEHIRQFTRAPHIWHRYRGKESSTTDLRVANLLLLEITFWTRLHLMPEVLGCLDSLTHLLAKYYFKAFWPSIANITFEH